MFSILSSISMNCLTRRSVTNLNSTGHLCRQFKFSAIFYTKSSLPKSPNNLKNDDANPEYILDTSFSDSKTTYKNKSTLEVLRGLVVFQMCSSNFLVSNNFKLMQMGERVLGKTLFELLMKGTFYGQFVGGEDDKRIGPVIKRLQSSGVKTMLDYAVEEDISNNEAVELEQASSPKNGQTSEFDQIGGELPQYKSHTKFADRRYKVFSARTYFYLNEAACEKNAEHFQKSLQSVATQSEDGMVAIKMTALGRPHILSQLSEIIMRARNFVTEITGTEGNILTQHLTAAMIEENLTNIGITDTTKFLKNVITDKEGVIHLFPWSGILNENYEINETFRLPSKKEGKMVRLIAMLTEEEQKMFRNMIRRLNTLIMTAQELGVKMVIDAEQTYFQPAISRITMEMMNKYNRKRPIVLNTYQCYLKNTLNEVTSDLEQAKRQNFYFGAKLVRGAYLDQERERAADLKYPDPINSTYDATTKMYHETLTECLRHIKTYKTEGEPNKVTIIVATHNENSVRFAIEQMKQLDIAPADGVVSFGQLYGMCDFITYPLGQAGYSSYKYVPYGPVNKVLPYLSRRALENRGVLDKLNKEKYLLRKELMRRLMTGQIFYKPVAK